MAATQYGMAALVKILVETQARKQDQQGRTALTIAAQAGQSKYVKILAPREKDIEDYVGKRARDYARGKCRKILRQFEKCRCSSDLFMAARKGCAECCRYHRDQAGQTRNDIQLEGWQNANRRTALMVAAHYGHVKCVEILVGAEAGMRDGFGRTALMFATRWGHMDCVRLLAPRESGIKDRSRHTALYYTVEPKSNRECAEYLWDYLAERKTRERRAVQNKHGLQETPPAGFCCAAVYLD